MRYRKKQCAVTLLKQNVSKGSSFEFNIEDSKSMLPFFLENDTLIVRNVPISGIHRGDVLVFKKFGDICAHRCIRKSNEGSKPYVVTKGDSVSHVDSYLVEEEAIFGKVIGIKRNGRYINFEPPIWRILNYFISLLSSLQASVVKSIKNAGALKI